MSILTRERFEGDKVTEDLRVKEARIVIDGFYRLRFIKQGAHDPTEYPLRVTATIGKPGRLNSFHVDAKLAAAEEDVFSQFSARFNLHNGYLRSFLTVDPKRVQRTHWTDGDGYLVEAPEIADDEEYTHLRYVLCAAIDPDDLPDTSL
jgi:hypothetical protein